MHTNILCSAMHRRGTIRRSLAYIGGVIVLGISFGCQNDAFGPPANPLAQQFWSVTLNAHAITMALTAPYNQFQLTLTPRQITGAPLVASGPVVYTASDTSVQIDSTGLLTAVAPDQQVQVIATMTIGGVHGLTLADTAYVNVNAVSPVPHVTMLAITFQPGDSARFNLDGQDAQGNVPILTLTALDATATSVPNLLIALRSRNRSAVSSIDDYLSSGGAVYMQLSGVGRSWLYAEATAYGVTLKDSILYTVTQGRHLLINIYPRTPIGSTTPIGVFSPQDTTIAVGGSVMWKNQLSGTQMADVVFDNPPGAILPPDSAYFATFYLAALSHTEGGNISVFAPCDSTCQSDPSNGIVDSVGYRGRSFPVAGTYPYHSALYHTTGVIHVVP